MRVRANASSAASRAAEASRARNAASADQRPDSIGEPGHVARLVRERGDAWIDQLRRAACRRSPPPRGGRPSLRQSPGRTAPARCWRAPRRRARASRRRCRDVADEADAAGQALLARQRLQLVERDLTGAGGVDRAADDVAAHAERLGQRGSTRAGTPRVPSSARRSPPGPPASRRPPPPADPPADRGPASARRVNSGQGPRRSTRGEMRTRGPSTCSRSRATLSELATTAAHQPAMIAQRA